MLHPQVYTRLGDIVFASFMQTGLELDFGILLPDPRYPTSFIQSCTRTLSKRYTVHEYTNHMVNIEMSTPQNNI